MAGWTSKATGLTDPAVRINRCVPKRIKTRAHTIVKGMAPQGLMVMPDNNLTNGVRSFLERQLYVKDRSGLFVQPSNPKQQLFDRRLEPFKKAFRKFVVPTLRLSDDKFVSKLPAGKRRAYTRAFEWLRSNDITIKHSFIKHFVKCENTNVAAKPDSVPRAICPRDILYCAALGPTFKPIEANVYRIINKVWGEVVVAKGLNSVQRGRLIAEKWHSFQNPVAIGLDAQRFDQHVSLSALRWEHSMYKLFRRGDGEFAKLLSWQLKNIVAGYFPDGKFWAKVLGHRMSGDPNTSCGNTLLMCAMIFCYCSTKNFRVKFINDGDDCVIFCERKHTHDFLNGLYEWFMGVGFRMTNDPVVDCLEQIEFCQAHPVWTPEGYIMIRNHLTARQKDVSSFKVRNEIEYERWINAIAAGGLSMTGGIPVFQEFYSSLGRSTKKTKKKDALYPWSGLGMLSKNMERKYSTVHDKTRASYYFAFGVLPSMQLELEKYYRKFTPWYTGGEFPTDYVTPDQQLNCHPIACGEPRFLYC